MNRLQRLVFLVVFVLILLGTFTDMMSDALHGASRWHLIKEGVVVGLSLAAIVYLGAGLHRESRRNAALRQELSQARDLAQRPGPEVLAARRQLQEVVSAQFDAWQLSPSERDVGFLLLKGLSLREIAALRNTNEKTVRQQASSLYRKAELPGRHAFAAWFLEDFL